MEKYLSKNFGVEKHSSKAALQRWRELCSVVKNSKRRFRYIADLEKRKEIEQIRSINKVSSNFESQHHIAHQGGEDQ